MLGLQAWSRAFRTAPTRRDQPISWAVAVASFVSIFFSMGLSFGSIGAMTLAFGEMFAGRASEDDISWIGGIRLCFVFLTGILSSILVNQFGPRPMQALGCAIAALAVGFSTLATELWHLYLAFGAVAGAGLSLVFTASSVIVEGHFERYLHIALPLSQLGDTVGYSVFPVLTQTLLNRVALRNTLLIFCGLTGVPLLLSVFYFPAVEKVENSLELRATPAVAHAAEAAADEREHEARKKTTTAGATTAKSDATDKFGPAVISFRPAPCAADGAINQAYAADSDESGASFVAKIQNSQSNGHSIAFDVRNVTTVAADNSLTSCGDGCIADGRVVTCERSCAFNTSTVNGDCCNSNELRRIDADCVPCKTLGIADGAAVATLTATDSSCNCNTGCPPPGQWERIRRLLVRCDVWLLLVNMFGWQYANAAIFVLLPSYMTRSGELDKDQAAIGLTLVGVANVVGNVVTVLAALRSYNRTLLYAVACLLFGVGVMLYTFTATNAAAYYALSSVNGFWLGILLGLTMSIIFDFADCGGLTDLFGLVTFFSGLGGLAGPGITGIIQTRVSDAVGLYVSGAASLLACAVLVAPAMRRRSNSSAVKSPVSS